MKDFRKFSSLPTAMSIILAGALMLSLGGCGAFDEDEHAGQKVTLEQVPPAVKATIEKERKGGTVKEIEKLTTEGKTTYAADVVVDGKEQELIIAEDGKVIPGHAGRDKDED